MYMVGTSLEEKWNEDIIMLGLEDQHADEPILRVIYGGKRTKPRFQMNGLPEQAKMEPSLKTSI
jgi:hypothetical protein